MIVGEENHQSTLQEGVDLLGTSSINGRMIKLINFLINSERLRFIHGSFVFIKKIKFRVFADSVSIFASGLDPPVLNNKENFRHKHFCVIELNDK